MNFPEQYPCIETPRLRLRPFTLTDGPDVQRLAGAREVADTTALIPHPYPDGAAEEWIATHESTWAAQRELVLAITLKPEGTVAGAVGLTFDTHNEKAELGYWMGVPFWNRGFATEAASAMIDFAFRVVGIQRVQAHHMARNPPSGRVMLKAGMRREGASPRALKKNDRFEDLVFYGITRRDWRGLGDLS